MENNDLLEHFFRNQYGKILAVISKYVDVEHAEDIVQDTLMTATEHWKLNNIPPNPEAWLYKTAKNKTLNFLRKRNNERQHLKTEGQSDIAEIEFSGEEISDDMLRMMLTCCNKSLSTDITITLILKVLCGFSIAEIAAAFCTSTETINKRLVRGRKTLKANFQPAINLTDLNENTDTLLKVVYILFNEGYLPARKDQTFRKDLCLEAIRLTEIIVKNRHVGQTQNAHALLALMYLNCSRFEARVREESEMIEMEFQDRTLWNQDLINKGLHHLSEAQQKGSISKYLILASISGNHCIAATYEETNWQEILSLYDALLTIEDHPIIRLNRVVALSKVKGATNALVEIQELGKQIENHLFYAVLGQLKAELSHNDEAIACYEKAIELSQNSRDKEFFRKKLDALVPN